MQKRCQQRMPSDSSKMPTTATKDVPPSPRNKKKKKRINKYKMGLAPTAAAGGGGGWSRPPPLQSTGEEGAVTPAPMSGGGGCRCHLPDRRTGGRWRPCVPHRPTPAPGRAVPGAGYRPGRGCPRPAIPGRRRHRLPHGAASEIRSEVLRLFPGGEPEPARGSPLPSFFFFILFFIFSPFLIFF